MQKYLYQQAVVSEVVYNADLSTRCGNRYFEQLLRDRYKDDMKPMPFIYCLKDSAKPIYSSFVKQVTQKYPQIRTRENMKLKGVNKTRIRT